MGGGVIGCEYASMFAAFGIKVTLLDRRTHLLRFIDHEVAQNLLFHMRANGVTLWLNEELARVSMEEGGVVTELKSGKWVESDVLLYAMGRTPNTEGLNLEGIGVALDKQGQVPVNPHYQTSLPHIYAVGDVIGFPALASTSMEQGRVASAHAFGLSEAVMTPTWPYGIYTVPEVSTVGKGEEELTEAKVPYEVGRAFFREIAKGQIVGDLDGLLKLIFHRQTHELLGVHIIGEGATELVHIGQVVMGFKGKVDFFVSNVFNYPTLAECYRVAALDGLNRLGKARAQVTAPIVEPVSS
jgi:NAD(P) transhydrogenase